MRRYPRPWLVDAFELSSDLTDLHVPKDLDVQATERQIVSPWTRDW